MFICRIENPSYALRGPLKAMTPEEYAAFRKAAPSIEAPEDQADVEKWWHHNDCVLDMEELEVISNVAAVSIKKVKGLGSYTREKVGDLERITYQVSVPNVGLLAVDHVDVLENCCTDELQQRLNEGWRILAVCPPNDTRRPDYIIGRIGGDK